MRTPIAFFVIFFVCGCHKAYGERSGTVDQFTKFIERWDENNDNKLSFEEYRKSFSDAPSHKIFIKYEEIMDSFRNTDLNHDGFITAEEFISVKREHYHYH